MSWFTALDASWMRSAAWRPIIHIPRISPVSERYMSLAMPSASFSARALEFALNEVFFTVTSKPSSSPLARACSSVMPTKDTSGCVKHAAGTELWLSTLSRPHMHSIAAMPCADAACASIILPLASPMHHTPSITSPSLSRACMRSFTGTKPRWVSTLMEPRPRPSVKGARPVATRHASTSMTSTTSRVLKSESSMVTGFSPGMPGVTLVARTFVT
mmetsp:Transcript_1797/g.7265  ORF Transcript_1797/g.7265 Transcript_1797/m.7265 type:complete len:216 (+) Transcript_1797:203-850(+)